MSAEEMGMMGAEHETAAEKAVPEKERELTIEETFAALDELIDRLESGKGSLEDAFKNYEEGMRLVKSCNEKIERIETQIQVLSGDMAEEEDDGIHF